MPQASRPTSSVYRSSRSRSTTLPSNIVAQSLLWASSPGAKSFLVYHQDRDETSGPTGKNRQTAGEEQSRCEERRAGKKNRPPGAGGRLAPGGRRGGVQRGRG